MLDFKSLVAAMQRIKEQIMAMLENEITTIQEEMKVEMRATHERMETKTDNRQKEMKAQAGSSPSWIYTIQSKDGCQNEHTARKPGGLPRRNVGLARSNGDKKKASLEGIEDRKDVS